MRATTSVTALYILVLSACGQEPSTPPSGTVPPPSPSPSVPVATPSGRPVATADASSSAKPNEAPKPPSGPRPSDAELAKLTKANNTFAFALWSKLSSQKGDLAFSPFSAETALAMTWLGAKGETASQMKTVLAFDGTATDAAEIEGRYVQSLGGPVTINVANRLFGERSFTFEKNFLDEGAKYFAAPFEPLDFVHAADQSRVAINGWVATETHDRIKDLVPPGAISPDTRLAVVNAIYFLGDWDDPFKKEATRPAAFHTSAKDQHDVPTMNQQLHAAWAEDASVSVLDLPYAGGGYSMTFVLPKNVDGLDEVEKKLSADGFEKWIGAEQPTRVNVALPKFTIDTKEPIALGDALVALGMKDAFDRKKADFTGIAYPPKPEDRLYICKVFHKAFVKVDEKGTEAAAATAVIMNRAGAAAPTEPPKEFRADHPFLFFLRDAKSNTILFAGRVADPVAQ
jgi:serpin B